MHVHVLPSAVGAWLICIHMQTWLGIIFFFRMPSAAVVGGHNQIQASSGSSDQWTSAFFGIFRKEFSEFSEFSENKDYNHSRLQPEKKWIPPCLLSLAWKRSILCSTLLTADRISGCIVWSAVVCCMLSSRYIATRVSVAPGIESRPVIIITRRQTPERAKRALNKEILLGGGGGGVVVWPTNPRTNRRAQQQPTRPPTHTHPGTIQGFCADTHRLPVKAILRLISSKSNAGTQQ